MTDKTKNDDSRVRDLTHTFCSKSTEALLKGAKSVEYTDKTMKGLIFRVSETKRVWEYMFTIPGSKKRARHGLGTFPVQGEADARAKYKAAKKLVEDGIDPRKHKEALADVANATLNIDQLIDKRFKEVVEGENKTDLKWKHQCEKYISPYIGTVLVKDFRPAIHHQKVIQPLLDRKVKDMALSVHRTLFGLMAYAVNKVDGVEFNRMAGVKPPKKAKPCDRALEEEEIAIWWHSLPTALPKSWREQQIMRLELVTGQRSGEIAQMERKQFSSDLTTWTVPKHIAKNKREHIVPLSKLAQKLVREAWNATNSRFLFPQNTKDQPMTSAWLASRVGVARKKFGDGPGGLFGIEYWTPHDLRRTMITRMTQLGVPVEHSGAVVNHTKGGVTNTVYNKWQYLPEKTKALDLWGDWLAELIEKERPKVRIKLAA